jgi:NAD(P)-dependent dehydrogenase (short-subunit alcohol dehydrogenase family)
MLNLIISRGTSLTGRLENKVAVITGGGSGMGRETVLRFLREGAQIVFGDLNPATSQETLDLAYQNGYDSSVVQFVRTNVAEEGDVEAMVRHAVDNFGRIDCMFNNAGVGGAIGPITELAVEDWDATQNILLRGVFLGIKHAGRYMTRQQSGVILSTASVAGLGGGAGPHAYSAAKAGVVNLTRTAATELAEFKVRVNAIAPGLIVTGLTNVSGDMAERAPAKQPIARAGDGTDIASMATYLASDESSFITGQTFVVDGGLLARGPELWRREEGESNPMENMTGMSMGSTGEAWNIRPVET